MTKIVNNKELIKKYQIKELVKKYQNDLPTLHQKLKKELTETLIIGQLQFLEAGYILSIMKDKRTYESEDASRKISWIEFCSSPDFPLPGPTAEARRRKADMLIRVYRTFLLKFKIKELELASIGYTKLAMLSTRALAEPEKIDELLEQAKQLTEPDLRKALQEKGSTLADLNQCEHKEVKEIISYKCLECGSIFKKPPPGSTLKN